MDYSTEALEAWEAEAIRLNKRSGIVTAWIVIITYCGGLTLGNYLADSRLLTPDFLLAVWFPTAVLLPALWLQRLYDLRGEILEVAAMWSIALSLVYLTSFAPTGYLTYRVWANIPVFIIAGLVPLWKSRYGLSASLGHILIQFIGFSLLSPLSVAVLVQNWLFVFPVIVGAIWLSMFRYSITRANFLISSALKESNAQLNVSYRMISEKQSELEKKNKDITDSIQYARRIQHALLPSADTIHRHLPQSFVLYKPKDIVSGDFFWFARHDDLLIMAAVDCTGHGVPGAFMSLIGFNHLNMIINEMKIMQPSAILEHLNHNILHTLQRDKNNCSRDGMDIIICVIDRQAARMEFASAHRPLYMIRKGELTEYKGDKISIGDLNFRDRTFTSQHIDMLPGDRFYLATDGFADQFGGDANRKYYTKHLKSFLCSIQHASMAEQEHLLTREFEQWRGHEPQIDDVTVIGIEV